MKRAAPKTKTFDAVEESRKWREAISRRLNAMSRDARIAHLNALGENQRGQAFIIDMKRAAPKDSHIAQAYPSKGSGINS
jgi:indole-3-glycerol phosphate synthase